MRQEQVYAGPVLVDGERFYAEVWMQQDTAVVFSRPDNAIRLRLHDARLVANDRGQIVVEGRNDDGSAGRVEAQAAEQVIGALSNATVHMPEGHWEGATVTWTQYAVTIAHPTHETQVHVAATVRAYPREAYIVLADGSEVSVSLPVRLGCCGARR